MKIFLRCVLLSLLGVVCCMAVAQTQYAPSAEVAGKMSASLRALALDAGRHSVLGRRAPSAGVRSVCALVRTTDAKADVLSDGGCRVVDRIGDIFIADIPVESLVRLASDSRVCRIEAERGNAVQLDSMRLYTNTSDIYAGRQLPQAYTGSGVVVGVMDVGFDLTHPTFFAADGHSRISRFWDQLSADTIGSRMYVGAEYVTEADIMSYAHSRDGEAMTHGTHTLGIAAGGGAGTPYVGMAPESELCLVSNAVSGDEPFISDADMYKYTTATDVLGFKYIFDYATSVGKPCVISFSEGAPQDFRGDNQLMYEALERLVGPGRILVASAGNKGLGCNYVSKPAGRVSAGTFVSSTDNRVDVSVKTGGSVGLRTIIYNVSEGVRVGTSAPHAVCADGRVTLNVASAAVCSAADSTLADTMEVDGVRYVQRIQAYRSCYSQDDIVLDVTLTGPSGIGSALGHAVSMELVGDSDDAEAFLGHGSFIANGANAQLDDSDITHSILSPGSAPCVICVGSTSYRPQFDNWLGERKNVVWGATGTRSGFSSVGPTFDGRTKPDVMAPGSNVISAMSSFYMANQLDNPGKLDWLVDRQEYGGRTYGWSADCGTSMSTPAVAGIIALWLQANPILSPTDVLGILRRTCRPCGDYGAQTANYCGYGAIDGYAGLLDVLGLSGVDGLSDYNPRGVRIGVSGSVLDIAFDASPTGTVDVHVYAMDGHRLMTKRFDGGNTRYRVATNLPAGVYAVQVNGPKYGLGGSVLVRIK